MPDSRETEVLVAEFRRAASQLGRIAEDFDKYAQVLAEVSDGVSGNLSSNAVNFRSLQKALDVLATRVHLATTVPW